MSIFCFKQLSQAVRLPDKLRQAREEFGITERQASELTRIPYKYLCALEAADFTALPSSKTFRLAYVREYAEFLKLNPKQCVQEFTREGGLADVVTSHPLKRMRIFPFASLSIFIRNIVFTTALVLCGCYLVWQVRGILEPPKLAVYSPEEGFVAKEPNAVVQGETEKESKLTINGEPTMVNGAGKFEAKIDLSVGVNTITITATKKHGKTTTIVRHLVVEDKKKLDRISLKP